MGLWKFDGNLIDSSSNFLNGSGAGNVSYTDDIPITLPPTPTPTSIPILKLEVLNQRLTGWPFRAIDIKWNSIAGMVKYNVYARIANANNFGAALLSATGNTGTIAVNASSDYSLKVEGCDNLGKCVSSSQVFLPKMLVPTPAKRVFVTSTQYSGNLGGLAGADNICQTRANAINSRMKGGGSTWKAWLSSDTVSASSRLARYNGPYQRIDGKTVANNWADLTDGSLQNPINISELGTIVNSSAWTNTTANGSIKIPRNNSCNNWTSTFGNTRAGGTGAIQYMWADYLTTSCRNYMLLYCFEQ